MTMLTATETPTRPDMTTLRPVDPQLVTAIRRARASRRNPSPKRSLSLSRTRSNPFSAFPLYETWFLFAVNME